MEIRVFYKKTTSNNLVVEVVICLASSEAFEGEHEITEVGWLFEET